MLLPTPSPPTRQPGQPEVLEGTGRDAGEKSNGDPLGGNQPWEIRGPRRGGSTGPEAKPQNFGQAEGTWVAPLRGPLDPHPHPPPCPCAQALSARPRSSGATARELSSGGSFGGFFVYIRARWQTALAHLSQAGDFLHKRAVPGTAR